MFICKYCGTEYTEEIQKCSKCGAQFKESESKSSERTASRTIREVCVKYSDENNLYLDDTISPSRMRAIRKSFKIPEDETVIMVYDDTLFGNNKVGFAVCIGGLYWNNDWFIDSKRTFLNWPSFMERVANQEGYHISLGRGDVIGASGTGDEKTREQYVKLLKEIKLLISS